LQTGAGKQYAVYTPWFRSWIKYLHANPEQLEASEIPAANPKNARRTFKAIFAASIPAVPMNKVLTPADRKRFAALWPAGEHEAQSRLKKFLDERVPEYADKRNFPASNGTATLSVHHSVGTLAARTSVRMARDANSTTKKLDGGSSGIATWISEVAWRDFYKHVLAHWPYVCMAKPFKYEYANVEWEWNDEHFQRWCQGQTGFPIVDAAMRQLKHMGYMHNRCRMIVGSFLAKDLLLDWRLGEKYFMCVVALFSQLSLPTHLTQRGRETLIDGDFASNNGGWGFSASTGVDPQPYFRIFNPLLQSEKFDSSGEYIRTWVPELRDVVGNKAIHDPYGRGQGDVAERNGYPRGMVVHGECRERALGRYKAVGRRTG
jgi:deoxyribodipyrimidine photo-lyase